MKAGALALLALVLCLGSHGAGAQSIPVGASFGCKPSRACAGPGGVASSTGEPCTVGTNRLLRSEDLDNAYWTAFNGSVTPGVKPLPNGSATMDLLTSTSNGAIYHLSVAIAPASATFTFSGYVSSDDGTDSPSIGVDCNDGGNATCTCIRSDGGACTVQDAVYAANDCMVSATDVTTANVRLEARVTCAGNATAIHVLASGVKTINAGTPAGDAYVGGLKLETGLVATTYVRTVASTAVSCQ